MKKISIIVLSLIFVLIFTFSAFAHSHSGNVAELDVKYEYDEANNLITVTAGIINIADPTGITEVEYDVLYDKSNLKLKEFTAHMPPSWEQYADGQCAAEDLSMIKKEGLFRWAIMIFEESAGIKNDNELKLTLVFEVKKKKTSKIDFEFIYMTNGPLEVVSGNSSTINISFDEGASPSIDISDTAPSVPEIPSKEEAKPSVSEDINDSIGDNADSGANSSENNTDDLPQLFNPNNSQQSTPVSSENVSDISDEESSSGFVTIIIVIIIIVVILAGVVVFLVLRNKGKGK